MNQEQAASGLSINHCLARENRAVNFHQVEAEIWSGAVGYISAFPLKICRTGQGASSGLLYFCDGNDLDIEIGLSEPTTRVADLIRALQHGLMRKLENRPDIRRTRNYQPGSVPELMFINDI